MCDLSAKEHEQKEKARGAAAIWWLLFSLSRCMFSLVDAFAHRPLNFNYFFDRELRRALDFVEANRNGVDPTDWAISPHGTVSPDEAQFRYLTWMFVTAPPLRSRRA